MGKLTKYSQSMMEIISLLERSAIVRCNNTGTKYESPLQNPRLGQWGVYAHGKGNYVLEHWYEALRIIISEWEESVGLEYAVQYLKMMKCMEENYYQNENNISNLLKYKVQQFFLHYGDFAPKLNLLKQILLTKQKLNGSESGKHGNGPMTKWMKSKKSWKQLQKVMKILVTAIPFVALYLYKKKQLHIL